MKKRLLSLILTLTLVILALCSCEIFSENPNGNDPNKPVTDNGKYSQVVTESLEFDFADFRYEYQQLKGELIATVFDSEAVRAGEIVIGNTNRPITAAAAAALNNEISKSSKYDSGYIIYKEGGNVAVYFTISDMSTVAIANFVNKCIIEDGLILDDGIIHKELFVKREFETEKYWLALEAKAAPDVVEALRSIHSYFNGSRIVEWLANLYDPVTGGIYYSRSARDNEPFLPDIESTAQAISFLLNNNAISDRNILPNELKIKFIEFAKSLQSPRDGYFYHPQWPQSREELANDRYGRDIGWSTTTITNFLADYDNDGIYDPQYPNWCAPNGIKCAKHVNTTATCSFPQATAYYTSAFASNATVALSTEQSAAVAKLASSVVTPVAEVTGRPDYSSRAAFSDWLEAYNAEIKENSGRAHQLAAIKGEIKTKGYLDVVLDHLDRVQEEVFNEQIENGETPTGLWQRNVDYKAVWGLLKYMSFYNESGYQRKIDIKYVPYIIETCIKVIEMPADGDYASNDLYNQWSGISNLISNVKRFYGDSGVRQIYDLMQRNTASLISNSLEKIKPFKMEDGSFSARSNGITSANIYSSYIALGVVEGNVNSTGLICSMYRSIYSCLGLPVVPLCNADDGKLFVETVMNSEPIIKNETASGSFDFEDGNTNGIKMTLNNASSGAQAVVVPDPLDDSNNVLCFVSVAGESGGDTIEFAPGGNGTTCYVYECKFYVDSESADKIVLQSKLHDSYMIMFTKNGDKVRITDNATTSSTGAKYTNIAEVSTDEWFKLRVEYYLNCEQNGLEAPRIKVYLNGDYVLTSDNFYNSHNDDATPKNNYGKVTMFSPKASSSCMYLDDCLFEATEAVYSED